MFSLNRKTRISNLRNSIAHNQELIDITQDIITKERAKELTPMEVEALDKLETSLIKTRAHVAVMESEVDALERRKSIFKR